MSKKISQIPISSIEFFEKGLISLIDIIYPIGSIYISITENNPFELLGLGTWEKIANDKVLQGAGTRGTVGTTLNESLPNITGKTDFSAGTLLNSDDKSLYILGDGGTKLGVMTNSYTKSYALHFDASRSSSTYQDNAPVQQDAYLVNIWKRIS